MKVRLRDVCDFYSGTGFPNEFQGKKNGEFPFYKVGDISKNVLSGHQNLIYCENYIDSNVVNKIKGTIIPADTVVFAKIGEALKLNRRAITTCDCLIDNNTIGIKARTSKIRNLYFYYFMCNLDIQKLAESTTVPSVRKTKLMNVEIILPDINEQESIERLLNKITKLIYYRKQQLKKLDELVKSRFIEMFGDPLNNKNKFPMTTMGNEFKISSGGTPSTEKEEYWNNGTIPWIGSNMCQDIILYNNDGKFITEKGYKNSSAKLFFKGTVLVALVGATVGKTALLKFNTTTNQNIAGIDVNGNNKFNSEYIFYHLQFQYSKFMEIGDKKFKMANLKFIRELGLLAAPITLQNQFADFVKQTDKSKLEIQKSLDKLEILKKSLMQQYFG